MTFNVGVKYGPIKEEVWVNTLMSRLSKYQSHLRKHKYLMTSMKHILHIVSGLVIFSLIYVYLGYNQVLVLNPNRLWGMFTFRRTLFGLINLGATFQHAMDIAFHGLIRQIMVVYLDDVMYFQRRDLITNST